MQQVNWAKSTWKNNCFTQILIKEWSSESNKIWFIISQHSSSLPLLEALPFLPLFKAPPPQQKIYSVQFLSVAQSWTAACQASLSITNFFFFFSSPTFEAFSTHIHRVGEAIHPSHPLSSLLLLPSVFPSIRVFSNKSVLHTRWPKYCSFSFSISPSNL